MEITNSAVPLLKYVDQPFDYTPCATATSNQVLASQKDGYELPPQNSPQKSMLAYGTHEIQQTGRRRLSDCLQDAPLCDSREYNPELYLTTNEVNARETLKELAQQPIAGDTVIGVSGLFILNAVAARGTGCTLSNRTIEHIIVVDCSPRVERFWTFLVTVLGNPEGTREKILTAICDESAKNARQYWPFYQNSAMKATFCLKKLQQEITNGDSFLSSEEKFEKIHRIAQKGNLVFKRINMFSLNSFEFISTVLHTYHHEIDLVYVSNVSEFVQKGEHKENFLQCVHRVTGEATRIIASKSNKRGVFQQILHSDENEKISEDAFSYVYTYP